MEGELLPALSWGRFIVPLLGNMACACLLSWCQSVRGMGGDSRQRCSGSPYRSCEALINYECHDNTSVSLCTGFIVSDSTSANHLHDET